MLIRNYCSTLALRSPAGWRTHVTDLAMFAVRGAFQ